MESLPLPAIAGAAVALAGLAFAALRKKPEAPSSPAAGAPVASPLRGASLPPRASMPPRPSLRPSAPPPSFRESLRQVFVDPALAKNGVGFGRKCEWIVAKCAPEKLAAALGLDTTTATWRDALVRAIGGQGVAILGPVDGFTFAVGEPASFRIGASHLLDDPNLFVRVADAVAGEVLFFQSDARAEGFAWLRARPGLVERAFAVVDTHTFADDGPQDDVEEQVRGQRPVPEGEEWWPGEEDVLEMATGWSLDPWNLDERDLGAAPSLFAVKR
jgi:hypothetical protein